MPRRHSRQAAEFGLRPGDGHCETADISVTVVGDIVFATRIIASELPAHIPDWRYAERESVELLAARLFAGGERAR